MKKLDKISTASQLTTVGLTAANVLTKNSNGVIKGLLSVSLLVNTTCGACYFREALKEKKRLKEIQEKIDKYDKDSSDGK